MQSMIPAPELRRSAELSNEPSPSEELVSTKDNRENFFRAVIDEFKLKYDEKIAFLVVMHALPTSFDFIVALNKIPNARVAKIILKNSYKDHNTVRRIQNELRSISIINDPNIKDKLKDDPNEPVKQVEETGNPDEKVIILDIGGYFSHYPHKLNQCDRYIGTAEDTVNGEEKYLGQIQKFSKPIISAARCTLKGTEDYNVGKSIVHAAETMIRDCFNLIMENIGPTYVIGFGRIGRSIAAHLRQKGINVIIYDNDPVRMMEARSEGYEVADLETILKDASLIFCATGNRSLTTDDIEKLQKKSVFIASCTSAEDEFHLQGLKKDPQKGNPPYSRYTVKSGSKVYLLAHGNGINFYYKAIVGDYIRAVHAVIMLAAVSLSNDQIEIKKINKILPWQEEIVSRIWLGVYENIKRVYHVKWPIYEDVFLRKLEAEKLKKQLIEIQEKTQFTHSFKVVNIYGQSGNGKTTFASQFGLEYKKFYDLIWWFDFSEDFNFSMKNLARELDIKIDGESLENIQTAVVERLKNSTNFLLIFDSLDESDLQKKILAFLARFETPRGRKHFILISQEKIQYNFEAGSYREKMYLSNELSASISNIEDVVTYLRKILPRNENRNLKVLAEKLSYKLFDLRLAARFISVQYRGIVTLDYLRELDNNQNNISEFLIKKNIELLDEKESSDGVESLAAKTLQFFMILIFLDVKSYSNELLQKLASHLSINEPNKIIEHLISLGLLQKFCYEVEAKNATVVHEDLYSIHGLISKVCLQDYYIHKKEQFLEIAIDAGKFLNDSFKYDFYNPECQMCESVLPYIPHIEVYLNNLKIYAGKEYKKPEGLRVSYNTNVDLPDNLTILENDVLSNSDAVLLLYHLAAFYLKEYREYEKSYELYELILKILNSNLPVTSKLEAVYELSKIHLATNANLCMKYKFEASTKSYSYDDILAFSDSVIIKYIHQPTPNIILVEALITRAYSKKYRFEQIENDEEKRTIIQEGVNDLKVALEKLLLLEEDRVVLRIKASIYHALGEFYIRTGNYQNAIDKLKEARDIRKSLFEDDCHPDLARTRQKLAIAFLKLYEATQERNYLVEAKQLCELAYHAQLHFFMDTHRNLDETAVTREQISLAIEAYKRNHPDQPWDDMLTNVPPSPHKGAHPSDGRRRELVRKRPRSNRALTTGPSDPADIDPYESASDVDDTRSSPRPISPYFARTLFAETADGATAVRPTKVGRLDCDQPPSPKQ